MRDFDFYEFAGILVPGVIVLAGLAWLVDPVRRICDPESLDAGGLGLFLILAYAAGHLIQSFGNLVETIWWRRWGGMPTDWVRSGTHALIADQQRDRLEPAIEQRLGIEVLLSDIDNRAWYSVVRQVYAHVAASGNPSRIDTFNGTYGLHRGIASSLILLIGVTFAAQGFAGWRLALILAALAAVALMRMHRFGKHYGREVFVEFLALPSPPGSKGASK